MILPLKYWAMTPDATYNTCFLFNPLDGDILPYKPGGIFIDNTFGIGFLLLGGMEVVLIALISYPIDPAVDLVWRKYTYFKPLMTLF